MARTKQVTNSNSHKRKFHDDNSSSDDSANPNKKRKLNKEENSISPPLEPKKTQEKISSFKKSSWFQANNTPKSITTPNTTTRADKTSSIPVLIIPTLDDDSISYPQHTSIKNNSAAKKKINKDDKVEDLFGRQKTKETSANWLDKEINLNKHSIIQLTWRELHNYCQRLDDLKVLEKQKINLIIKSHLGDFMVITSSETYPYARVFRQLKFNESIKTFLFKSSAGEEKNITLDEKIASDIKLGGHCPSLKTCFYQALDSINLTVRELGRIFYPSNSNYGQSAPLPNFFKRRHFSTNEFIEHVNLFKKLQQNNQLNADENLKKQLQSLMESYIAVLDQFPEGHMQIDEEQCRSLKKKIDGIYNDLSKFFDSFMRENYYPVSKKISQVSVQHQHNEEKNKTALQAPSLSSTNNNTKLKPSSLYGSKQNKLPFEPFRLNDCKNDEQQLSTTRATKMAPTLSSTTTLFNQKNPSSDASDKEISTEEHDHKNPVSLFNT